VDYNSDAGNGDDTYHAAVPPSLTSGAEPIQDEDGVARGDLLGFWQWAYSQTLDNTLRGVLAEYIVGLALGVVDGTVRSEWDAFDLVSPEGIRVEVKSSAYLQSWAQRRPSRLTFGIPQTNAWSRDTGGWEEERLRQSQVYVFCAFTTLDPDTADPLDTRQWEFHVVSTARLDDAVGCQKSISLKELIRMVQPVQATFSTLAQAVRSEGSAVTGP
jgi:hypothetical protein